MLNTRRTLPILTTVLLGALLSCSTCAWELAVVKARAKWLTVPNAAANVQQGGFCGCHSPSALQVTCSFSFGRGSACIVDCINVAGAPCQGAYTTYGPYGKGAYAALGELLTQLCFLRFYEELRKPDTTCLALTPLACRRPASRG